MLAVGPAAAGLPAGVAPPGPDAPRTGAMRTERAHSRHALVYIHDDADKYSRARRLYYACHAEARLYFACRKVRDESARGSILMR